MNVKNVEIIINLENVIDFIKINEQKIELIGNDLVNVLFIIQD